jgi:hypothetical protein
MNLLFAPSGPLLKEPTLGRMGTNVNVKLIIESIVIIQQAGIYKITFQTPSSVLRMVVVSVVAE